MNQEVGGREQTKGKATKLCRAIQWIVFDCVLPKNLVDFNSTTFLQNQYNVVQKSIAFN